MDTKQLHHLGFVVEDLDRAMEELGAALGLDWLEPKDGVVGHWTTRFTSSVQGPPYYEVIQGPPGSPWDGSAGSRLDHIAYASPDPRAESERMLALGIPLAVDAMGHGGNSCYHTAAEAGTTIAFFDERSTNFTRAPVATASEE